MPLAWLTINPGTRIALYLNNKLFSTSFSRELFMQKFHTFYISVSLVILTNGFLFACVFMGALKSLTITMALLQMGNFPNDGITWFDLFRLKWSLFVHRVYRNFTFRRYLLEAKKIRKQTQINQIIIINGRTKIEITLFSSSSSSSPKLFFSYVIRFENDSNSVVRMTVCKKFELNKNK